jgi:hypothetical protein
MIRLNQQESALECTICGELEGMPAATMRNRKRLAMRMENAKGEHAGCEEHKDNPGRALAERRYALRMRIELARIA